MTDVFHTSGSNQLWLQNDNNAIRHLEIANYVLQKLLPTHLYIPAYCLHTKKGVNLSHDNLLKSALSALESQLLQKDVEGNLKKNEVS